MLFRVYHTMIREHRESQCAHLHREYKRYKLGCVKFGFSETVKRPEPGVWVVWWQFHCHPALPPSLSHHHHHTMIFWPSYTRHIICSFFTCPYQRINGCELCTKVLYKQQQQQPLLCANQVNYLSILTERFFSLLVICVPLC